MVMFNGVFNLVFSLMEGAWYVTEVSIMEEELSCYGGGQFK